MAEGGDLNYSVKPFQCNEGCITLSVYLWNAKKDIIYA